MDRYLLEAMLEVDALYPDTTPIAPSVTSYAPENRTAFLFRYGMFFENTNMWVFCKPVTIGEHKTHGVSKEFIINMCTTQWNTLKWELGWRP